MHRIAGKRVGAAAPILENKSPQAISVFSPHALLREARRQKRLPVVDVPNICILDPDGDILRHLRKSGRAAQFVEWPCYHTDLYTFPLGQETVGIIGCVVGAPFAVLIAEELFACGCRFLLSLTSAGQILAAEPPPYFVVIDRALRDEGTSYHYAAPSEFADADPGLVALAMNALTKAGVRATIGPSWTTDAPFRETAEAIEAARGKGIMAVEMEAAALYTFARTRNASVLCLAHVTNTMGQAEGDFEKGEFDGSVEALEVLGALAGALPTLEDGSPAHNQKIRTE
jgi:uridine phosphorylase